MDPTPVPGVPASNGVKEVRAEPQSPPLTASPSTSSDANVAPGEQSNGGREAHHNSKKSGVMRRTSSGIRRHSPQSPPAPNNCVVLKNLDYNITQGELEEVVRQVAGGRKQFVNIALIDDKNTKSFRGMAFVNFHTVEDATAAISALARMCINGRKVYAEYRRLHPGEKERKEAHEKRNKKYEQNASRQTFERDISPEVDSNGKTIDKRVAFFSKRDIVRKADDKKRVAEKAERDKEREAEFRARLLAYRDEEPTEGHNIEDICFESSLTPYERRMVHVICEKLSLGHMSIQDESGQRVLRVTKHPGRKAEWAEAVALERKAADSEDRKKGKDGRRETYRERHERGDRSDRSADRLGSGSDGRASPEASSAMLSRDNREGIKWFKPRAAQLADGETITSANGIRAPSYKLYVPPRQPTGPDGTIGFQSRGAKRSADSTNDTAFHDEGVVNAIVAEEGELQVDTSVEAAANAMPKKIMTKAGSGGDIEGDSRSSTSQTVLNPSVPAFTPSITFAS